MSLTSRLSVQALGRHLLAPVLAFLRIEAASGVLLVAATALALLWANSSWGPSYAAFWHTTLTLGLGAQTVQQDLLFIVNDVLMSAFFLLVGLEIRRELHEGVLAQLRVASLPLLAALGGVTAPALIYLAVSAPATRNGWAVPTATDIAFAVGVLSLVGSGVPAVLRLLLLTLAIADDIVAILIIAVFYSGTIHLSGLFIAAAGVLGLALLLRAQLGGSAATVVAGGVIWYGLLHAGVHPTLAGVIVGLMTPVRAASAAPRGVLAGAAERLRSRMWLPRRAARMPAPGRLEGVGSSVCTRIETALHPWVSYLIMPLFALANAGVDVQGLPLTDGGLALRVAAGIVLGLVVGKPLGIIVTSLLSVRLGLAARPAQLRSRHLVLLGSLGGIGFTMSMFLSNLAFTDATLLRTAKLAVLTASLLAAVIGVTVGRCLPGIRHRAA